MRTHSSNLGRSHWRSVLLVAGLLIVATAPVEAKLGGSGRGIAERRMEVPAQRGWADGYSGSRAAGPKASAAVRDVRDKTSRGVFSILGGQRPSYSGPTHRLGGIFRDRVQRVLSTRR